MAWRYGVEADWVKACLAAAAKYEKKRDKKYDEALPDGWALSPELPTVNVYGGADLLGESNVAFITAHLEGLEAREADAHDGTLGDDFEEVTLDRRDYITFRPWDEDDNGKQIPSEVAEDLYQNIFDPLETSLILDEDDLTEREQEDTLNNIREEGERWVRDDAPATWPGDVADFMSQHDEYQHNLESRDGGGGYPDEDDLLEVMHELGLLDAETEKEHFTELPPERTGEIHTRYIGPVTVELHFHHNEDGGWNHVFDGLIRLTRGDASSSRSEGRPPLTLRFKDAQAKLGASRSYNHGGAASVLAADVLGEAWRQKTSPGFADALQEAFGEFPSPVNVSDENDKTVQEYTGHYEPRDIKGHLEFEVENPSRKRARG